MIVDGRSPDVGSDRLLCTTRSAHALGRRGRGDRSALCALGDPARVRIVNILATVGGEVCGCELTNALELAQPTVSHHLKKLHDAGLLEREQPGKWAFYSLSTDVVRKLAAVTDLGPAADVHHVDRAA